MSFPSSSPDKMPQPQVQPTEESSRAEAGQSEDELLQTVLRQTKALEDERADSTDLRAAVHLTAAQQGPNPRQKLGKGKRLGQVVIGTGLQTRNDILYRILGRQHEDRSDDLLGPQLLEHGEAVLLRQHPVEHDQVHRLFRGQRQPFLAVGSQQHFVVFLFEPSLDKARHLLFVFNDQNTHTRFLLPFIGLNFRGIAPTHQMFPLLSRFRISAAASSTDRLVTSMTSQSGCFR